MTENDQIHDAELVEMLKAQNRDAMHYLYAKYNAALYGFIYHILQDESKAQEALVQTFADSWQQASRFDSNSNSFFTWIINLARKNALKVSDNTEPLQNRVVPQSNLQLHRNTDALDDDEAETEEIIDLNSISRHLRKEQKDLLDLVFFYGYTQQKAAEKLRMPIGTVKNRMRSALIELRKLFQTI